MMLGQQGRRQSLGLLLDQQRLQANAKPGKTPDPLANALWGLADQAIGPGAPQSQMGAAARADFNTGFAPPGSLPQENQEQELLLEIARRKLRDENGSRY